MAICSILSLVLCAMEKSERNEIKLYENQMQIKNKFQFFHPSQQSTLFSISLACSRSASSPVLNIIQFFLFQFAPFYVFSLLACIMCECRALYRSILWQQLKWGFAFNNSDFCAVLVWVKRVLLCVHIYSREDGGWCTERMMMKSRLFHWKGNLIGDFLLAAASRYMRSVYLPCVTRKK
jgi:hypothetical protein